MRRGELVYSLVALALVLGWLIHARAGAAAYLVCALFAVLIFVWLISHLNQEDLDVVYERETPLLSAAFRSGDVTAARQHLRAFDSARIEPINAASLDMNEAVILCYEEKYAEARAILEKIDPRLLDAFVPSLVPYLINNIAVCDTHLGSPARAVEALRPLMQQLEGVPKDLRSSVVGTTGIAYFVLQNWSSAVSLLEEAVKQGGSPFSQSIRAFYLGEAYSALGETAKALAAYNQAIQECPTSRYAERARQKLVPKQL